MSWTKKEDHVAVFAGDVGTNEELAELASIVGGWDHDHQESGMGSYAFSYAPAVIKAMYAMGLHPSPSQLIHGYVPDLAPGPIAGMKDAIYVGAFQRNQLAKDWNETAGMRRNVDAFINESARLEIVPPISPKLGKLLEDQAWDKVWRPPPGFSLESDKPQVLMRGRLFELRYARKQLRKIGQATRLVKMRPKKAEQLRAFDVLRRCEDMLCGIVYYLDGEVARYVTEQPPPKKLEGPHITWSARQELEGLRWADENDDKVGQQLYGKVAAWITALEPKSGTELVPKLDVYEHVAPEGWRVWLHHNGYSTPWIVRFDEAISPAKK